MAAPVFRPVRPTRVHDRVFEQIRAAILRGDLRPGDSLPRERKLAAQCCVSRVGVRDAPKTLEAGGLVPVEHGGGPHVAARHGERAVTMVRAHLDDFAERLRRVHAQNGSAR